MTSQKKNAAYSEAFGKTALLLLAIIGGLFLLSNVVRIFVHYYPQLSKLPFKENMTTEDFTSVINNAIGPILTSGAIILTLYTIHKSDKNAEKQAKIQRQDRFESRFFVLLSHFRETQSTFNEKPIPGYMYSTPSDFSTHIFDMASRALSEFQKIPHKNHGSFDFNSFSELSPKERFKVYSSSTSQIADNIDPVYIGTLSNILDFQQFHAKSIEEPSFYIKTLVCQISKTERVALFYYSLNPKSDPQFCNLLFASSLFCPLKKHEIFLFQYKDELIAERIKQINTQLGT